MLASVCGANTTLSGPVEVLASVCGANTTLSGPILQHYFSSTFQWTNNIFYSTKFHR
jgi:hypothetical protein